MKRYFLFAALFQSYLCFGAQIEHHAPNPHEIRVVPVDPTPEPDATRLIIAFPEPNEIKTKNPVHLQIHVDGYPLQTMSDFPRKEELANDENGQSIRVIIDDNSSFNLYEPLLNSQNDIEEYYDQLLDYDIPYRLSTGFHIIRTFPIRSYGESLKGDGCFAASGFYFGTKKDKPKIDLSQPYLTYNEPQGTFSTKSGKPILLDFYISNCQLSKDGYKVRLSIDGSSVDGNSQRLLTQWVPYYIYGLEKGSHTIRLELLDTKNKLVNGPYSDVQHTITVK